jgi:ATP-binding cassette, subfamily B, bacterial HlyB/CyaB
MRANTSPAIAPEEDTAASASAEASPRASPASAPLSALCLIARLHHIAADPAHLAHQLGWPASHAPDVDDLLLAAKRLGLKAKRSRSSVDRLNLAPLPALALMKGKANRSSCSPNAMASACC